MLSARTKHAALVDVNRIRERYGVDPIAELPPGTQRDCYACPVANALSDCVPLPLLSRPSAHVTVTPYAVWIAGELVYTSRALGRFVRRFDNGEYPELVA